MNTLVTLLYMFAPWLLFFGFIWLCIKMVAWAKNRKSGAIAFGLFFQMILPDPSAENTIKAVVERKQEVKKQQDENGDLLATSKSAKEGDKSDDQ